MFSGHSFLQPAAARSGMRDECTEKKVRVTSASPPSCTCNGTLTRCHIIQTFLAQRVMPTCNHLIARLFFFEHFFCSENHANLESSISVRSVPLPTDTVVA